MKIGGKMNSYNQCMRVLVVVETEIEEYYRDVKGYLEQLTDGLNGCQLAEDVEQELATIKDKLAKASTLVADHQAMIRG